jgi:hypothetical protein
MRSWPSLLPPLPPAARYWNQSRSCFVGEDDDNIEAEDAVEGEGEGEGEGGGTGDWMYLLSRQKENGVACRIRSTA